MTEQTLQKQMIKYLESIGCWTVKTIQTNKRGTPDIIACLPDGRFLAVEVKAKGKLSTVTAIQRHQISQILLANGLALAVDNLDDLKKYLN